MLGAMVTSLLETDKDLAVTATVRSDQESIKKVFPGVEIRLLDAETATVKDIARAIKGSNWVVNAIGIIKPYIHDDNAEETTRALRVNSLFPHLLAEAAQKAGAQVIQIATDCVYSGKDGMYPESALHDALDVYGKTKSLGEVYADNVHHLRCSIIGPEPKAHVSLLDWFLGQVKEAAVNGYTNHRWNGVTTLHFGKLARGIIKNNIELDHIQHIIPTSTITKADMLKTFAKEFKRDDVTVNPGEAEKVIDRTLSTENEDKNKELWRAAGYETPPTVEVMIAELAKYKFPTF